VTDSSLRDAIADVLGQISWAGPQFEDDHARVLADMVVAMPQLAPAVEGIVWVVGPSEDGWFDRLAGVYATEAAADEARKPLGYDVASVQVGRTYPVAS
jgi:hypothetical protein